MNSNFFNLRPEVKDRDLFGVDQLHVLVDFIWVFYNVKGKVLKCILPQRAQWVFLVAKC